MYGKNLRFLIVAVLAIIVLVIAIIVIILNSSKVSHSVYVRPLASYASNPTTNVSMLIDGPETSSSNHNQVLINVNNSTVTINAYVGYNNKLLNFETFPNTEASFHVFLRSLEFSQFNVGSSSTSLSQASGFCPQGDRYIFSTSIDNHQTQRYWITNCSGLQHTFNGNFNLTYSQFIGQIPNYYTFVNNLNI